MRSQGPIPDNSYYGGFIHELQLSSMHFYNLLSTLLRVLIVRFFKSNFAIATVLNRIKNY